MIAPEVVVVKGSLREMTQRIPGEIMADAEPGFVQFRAFDDDDGVYALCPGFR